MFTAVVIFEKKLVEDLITEMKNDGLGFLKLLSGKGLCLGLKDLYQKETDAASPALNDYFSGACYRNCQHWSYNFCFSQLVPTTTLVPSVPP